MLLCDFFFLLKFIFQDFVEYQNVWPCWVCSLCALSKSYFLLPTSQYWERFENVSFFLCAVASKRSNMVLELDEAKPISTRLQRIDRIGLQEVFIEGDSISMIHYGPSYRRCQNGYANLTMNDCINLKNLTRTNFLWKFKTGVKWKKKKKKNEREGKDQTSLTKQILIPMDYPEFWRSTVNESHYFVQN